MSGRPLLDVGNYIPRYGASESGNSNDTPILPYSDEQQSRAVAEKRLLRKLDLRVAFLVLIYIMNYMDRSNAAAARLRGFEEDLNMKGNQFNTLISILYVGYVLMQAPSSHEKAIAVPFKLHGNMGCNHLVHWYCPNVSRSSDLTLSPGICRSGILSWGCIPSFAMVQAQRTRVTHSTSYLRKLNQ